ncbi:MAG: alanine racemase [Firmicutes bacterium]|nr:alanine racemase [Bacillota bacterium]
MEYYRLTADIDLDAIAYNIKNIKNSLEKDTQLLAIVKADAYGHGALEVARVCLFNGADQLAVATCDEGVALREAGITAPILILGNTVDVQMEKVIKYRLTQTVYDYEISQRISNTAVRMNAKALVHLKVDTGMGRIGVSSDDEGLAEADRIFSLPMLNITGIFTHFATADEKDKTFTKEQYGHFKYMCDNIEGKHNVHLIKHCANSGSILDTPEYQMDMVRAGIIIYGLYPSNEVTHSIALKPAMSVRTQVSYVKELDENISVGYGRTYFTNKKTKVATIPIGYADGYPRALSNKGKVIINGQYAPIIGNVCMDQAMIDVTHIPDVKTGDTVTVLGKDGGLEITAEELAALQGTINYEVVCNFSKRVPRAYYRKNELIYTVNSI